MRIKNYFYSFGVPIVYAFILRAFFLQDFFGIVVGIVSFVFLFLGPICIGAITVALSPFEFTQKLWFKLFAPWVSIIFFLSLTYVLGFEGAICLFMAAPIFLFFASIGGLIGGELKKRRLNDKLNILFIVILPLLISPVEKYLNSSPETFEAYTSIIINAPIQKIWENVVRVREISEKDDNGKLSKVMGFPRPIKAELDSLRIGGKRKAIFDNGLIFDETVNYYEPEKKMSFSITPLTSEIPPSTLDEHVIVGGKYFTVLDGNYEVKQLNENQYELILYSHFQLNTTFNFYSGIWSKFIMKDIQDNILTIIKRRSEI